MTRHQPPLSAVQSLSAVAVAVGLLVLSGCANLAPSYMQPAAPVPGAWNSGAMTANPAVTSTTPGTAATAAIAATPGDAGEPLRTGWQDFFVDERLRSVVGLALANNRDARVAALNIERARAQYGIARSAAYPSVSLGASGSRSRSSGSSGSGANGGTGGRVSTQYSVDLGLASYELDFFGRVRNLGDAALESYFATEESRRSTQISLVAEVATAWLTLATDQQRLQLARDTLTSRQKSFELIDRSFALGAQSGIALAQARSTVEAARVDVAQFDSQVEQDRNALNLLAGTVVPPALLPKDTGVAATPAARLLAPPAGLPSSVLQQRPDVLAAEHLLRASNADIGAARAAFYPRIALTASAGTASGSLSGLFGSGTGIWSFSPSISLPIFNGGANRANLRVAEVQQQLQLADYEKTLQVAFREVADALAARRTLAERMSAQQALLAATSRSYQLSDALFRSGGSGYLDVLDAQRSLYSAQQSLISLQLVEQVNRITVYRVLGGGWSEASLEAPAGQ
ncbi:MAG: efflux transporter outer membrane subunit [Comamonadaceae bacterium]|nr:MAG: efflux transporter outer membrane subunit [Comamonadaceae bacterium]